MSAAAELAQAFERLAALVRACPAMAEAIDSEVVSVPVADPAVWLDVVAALEAEDVTHPGSPYVTVSRWFGPVEVVAYAAPEVVAAAERGVAA